MTMIPLLLIVLAVVMLFLAAINIANLPRWSWGWGGLFVLALVELLYRGSVLIR